MSRGAGSPATGAFTGTAANAVEVSISGGILSLNRFLMTLQNKRMPLKGFTLGRDREGLRATVLLDCPEEDARRYTTVLAGLEDVKNTEAANDALEVVLLKVSGVGWKESEAAGVSAHESGGTVVASGRPADVAAWISGLEDVEDIVRLGPVARPGNGGD
ncbi:MAG: hypothetical protein H0V53_11670 [Rubrobacter sp.]|nr:hypothetical protein [Rubrobacter sp.]